MTLDEVIDLLTQISIYAGIAAVVLFAIMFVLIAIAKSAQKKKLASGEPGGGAHGPGGGAHGPGGSA